MTKRFHIDCKSSEYLKSASSDICSSIKSDSSPWRRSVFDASRSPYTLLSESSFGEDAETLPASRLSLPRFLLLFFLTTLVFLAIVKNVDTISIRFLPCILYRGDEAVDITGWWSEIVGVEVGRISGFFTLFDLTGETDLDFLWGCSRLITFDFTGLRIRSPGKNTVVRENVCRSNVFAFMERTKNL